MVLLTVIPIFLHTYLYCLKKMVKTFFSKLWCESASQHFSYYTAYNKQETYWYWYVSTTPGGTAASSFKGKLAVY